MSSASFFSDPLLEKYTEEEIRGAEFRPLDWAPNGELLLSDGEWYANITENGISVELGPENGAVIRSWILMCRNGGWTRLPSVPELTSISS